MAGGQVVRLRATISGQVQGVGFRAATRDKALAGGLVGWVRNLDDGRVEAVFQGAPDSVDEAIGWCARGPAQAKVKTVEVLQETLGNETSFDVRR